MTPTKLRDRVANLAPTDIEAALAGARKIKDPWFRCQALAWVARYGPEGRVLNLCSQSLKASAKTKDSFCQAAVASWPLRALIERNRTQRAEQVLSETLDVAEHIEHPVRRIEALFLILQAIVPLGGEGLEKVAGQLLDACRTGDSWRASYRAEAAALMLAKEAPELSKIFLNALPEGKYKRRAQRGIEAENFVAPRPFFWERSRS